MYLYIIPPIYVLIYFVIGFLLHQDFGLSNASWMTIVAGVILLAAALVGLVGCFLEDGETKFLLHAFHNIWLALFIYFIMLYGAMRLILALGHLYNDRVILETHRLMIVLICILIVVTTSIYGFFHARRVHTTRYTVTSNAPHFENKSLRIGFVADMHLGVNTSLSVIDTMVAKVNAEKPDIILLGGDYFNSSYNALDDPESYIEVLKKFKAPLGVYAVYGNHDNVENLLCGFPMSPLKEAYRPKEMDDFMEAANIKVLNDESVRFGDYGVTLVGRQSISKTGDGTTKRASVDDVLDDEDLEDAVIVLQHEPEELKALDEAGVSLSLSGHTHDGQFFPLNIVSRLFVTMSYGRKTFDNSLTAVTTSGVGFYGPPIRVGTKSEIVIIDYVSSVTSFNNC